MADIAKIQLNGNTFDVKDTVARTQAANALSSANALQLAIQTKQNQITFSERDFDYNEVTGELQLSENAGVTVDAVLSLESVNPVQNRILTQAISALQAQIGGGEAVILSDWSQALERYSPDMDDHATRLYVFSNPNTLKGVATVDGVTSQAVLDHFYEGLHLHIWADSNYNYMVGFAYDETHLYFVQEYSVDALGKITLKMSSIGAGAHEITDAQINALFN